jgi:ABC-type cobalamin/Fe3+-siderophores transport system ATPase subunit
LKEGRIVASGATREVLTAETISAVFGVQAEILEPRGQSAPAVWTGPLDSQ